MALDTEPSLPANTWPTEPPNPCAPVQNPPWDAWLEPWTEGDWEENHLATWFFFVGMMLWEVQEGLHRATDLAYYLPPDRFLRQALEWFLTSEPPKRPPAHHHRKLATWERRQVGIECYLTALLAREQQLDMAEFARGGRPGMAIAGTGTMRMQG